MWVMIDEYYYYEYEYKAIIIIIFYVYVIGIVWNPVIVTLSPWMRLLEDLPQFIFYIPDNFSHFATLRNIQQHSSWCIYIT